MSEHRTRSHGIPSYGHRNRFGPYWLQAVRFLGRSLERLGQRLDEWSWSR